MAIEVEDLRRDCRFMAEDIRRIGRWQPVALGC